MTMVPFMADCSVTLLPELLDPRKKLYEAPGVLFTGLSLDLKNCENMLIALSSFQKMDMKKAGYFYPAFPI